MDYDTDDKVARGMIWLSPGTVVDRCRGLILMIVDAGGR